MTEKSVKVNRKEKNSSLETLQGLNKEELIAKIQQLDAHNKQLKNILQKQGNNTSKRKNDTNASGKNFDFKNKHKRHVLLKFLYFGWDYQGYASQEDSAETIEYYLFSALQKTCLIESRESSNYHRCGRTDKGVSAFCQVISIDLRSKFPEDEQFKEENLTREIDYCEVLNRVLPKDVKCISWMPLHSKVYSARFDCIQRTYRYFFPAGNLNVEKMKEGCAFLIGTHDFRNLCKMDVANGVTNFTRKIISADIKPCDDIDTIHSGYEMYYLEIKGQSFLWHQIRCIMAILLLIGRNDEDPEIIRELLNVNKHPCKPQYSLAAGFPLNLYDCEFRSKTIQVENDVKSHNNDDAIADTTKWIYSEENLLKLIETLQNEWTTFSIKTTMIREILKDVESIYSAQKFSKEKLQFQGEILEEGVRPRKYQKLLQRQRCESLENRLDHYIKRQRLIAMEDS